MFMAIGLTVSEVGRGQRSERSGHNKIDIRHYCLTC